MFFFFNTFMFVCFFNLKFCFPIFLWSLFPYCVYHHFILHIIYFLKFSGFTFNVTNVHICSIYMMLNDDLVIQELDWKVSVKYLKYIHCRNVNKTVRH